VLYSDREVGGEVGLPRHWMRDFFLASLCLEVQENQEGLSRLQVILLTNNPVACHCNAHTMAEQPASVPGLLQTFKTVTGAVLADAVVMCFGI